MAQRDFRTIRPQPPMLALDRLGKSIEAGHLVLFHNMEDLIFEVTEVHPVLDPGMRMADGSVVMQVGLVTQVPLRIRAAEPSGSLVIIGETQARIKARIEARVGAPDDNGRGAVVGSIQPADAPAEPPDKIVITDAEQNLPLPVVWCNQCGAQGEEGTAIGVTCVDCGCGSYQPMEQA